MRRALALLVLAAWASPAAAQLTAPQVVAKAPADPAFDPAAAVVMRDDGVAPDLAATDGIWTGELVFDAAAEPVAPRTFEYVVIPPDADLTAALGAADGGPMRLAFPDGAARVVAVRYATAADPDEPLTATCTEPAAILACLGWAPSPALSDDWNAGRTFTAVGSFQEVLGGAAWDPASAATALGADDSVAFLTSAPLDGLWEVSAAGAAPRLGPTGWWFDAPVTPRTGQPVQAPAWQVVHLALLRDRGMLRASTESAGMAAPLLTEIVVDPAAPFVELHNPSPWPLSLAGVWLSDAPEYPRRSESPMPADAGDFTVGFPAGAFLAPGAYATVALSTAADFQAAYGAAPDFVLAELPAAYAGAVGAAPALVAAGELLALYTWSPGDALVSDLDLVVWGAPAVGDEAPVKTGVVVGAATYGDDAGTVNALPAPAGTVIARRDLTEGAERRGAAYNGVYDASADTRHDETDEALSDTWAVAATPSPGGPAAGFTFALTGTVTDADDAAPIEGAVVTAAPGGATATTGTDGTYALTLPEGTHQVTASAAGYLDGDASVVLGGDRVVDFALVPFAGYRVRGRVERESGAPLEGADVTLESAAGNQTVRSAADGTFTFQGVDPGSYGLRATRTGFHPAATTANVAGADVTGIVLVLVPVPVGYDVSGRVTDATTAAPIAGAVLEFAGAGLTAVTDAAGHFAFRLVPDGRRQLTAAAQGYAAQTVEVVVQGAPVAGVEIALARATEALTLRGRVRVKGLALPIPDADVRLEDAAGTVRSAVTDAQGGYVIGGLPAGSYALVVSAPSYLDYTEPALELLETTERDVELERAPGTGFALSGAVHLSDREATRWAGSTVRLTGPRNVEVRTGEGGAYRVDDLVPAVYRVTASRDAYTSASLSVTVTADAVQDFILTPPAPETVSGCGCSAVAAGPGAGWTGAAAGGPGAAGGGAGAALVILLGLGAGRRRRWGASAG